MATLKEQVAALTLAVEALVAAQAPAPVKPAVAKPKFADTAFGREVLAKQVAKVACAIHPATACARKFRPTSAGAANHVARLA